MTIRRFGEFATDLMDADGLAVGSDRNLYEAGIERLATAKRVLSRPAPDSPGSPGQLYFEPITPSEGPSTTGYLYLCHAPDTWVRVEVESTWT